MSLLWSPQGMWPLHSNWTLSSPYTLSHPKHLAWIKVLSKTPISKVREQHQGLCSRNFLLNNNGGRGDLRNLNKFLSVNSSECCLPPKSCHCCIHISVVSLDLLDSYFHVKIRWNCQKWPCFHCSALHLIHSSATQANRVVAIVMAYTQLEQEIS